MIGAIAFGVLAGIAAGMLGIGGGAIFVPGLVIFLGLSHLDAEATSLLAMIPVALVGAWRDVAGGLVLTTADFYSFDHAALERPDLLGERRPRTVNHVQVGHALTAANPPVRATIVYNNNPVAVCPESDKVIAGFSREDLFTVVLEVP